ncbi:MAG: hypothetical protein KAR83_10410 [Thermodesulfovibrionales bacterium]|nr:hypothetical protein [Thermodesulfovibrionales bacterium]
MKALTEKNKGRMASHIAIAGCGAALTVFAIYGLLNASLIGGLVGLNITGAIMGYPVESTLVAKVIVSLSMLAGVTVAALTFAIAGTTLGWVAGKTAEIATHPGRSAHWVHDHLPHAHVRH